MGTTPNYGLYYPALNEVAYDDEFQDSMETIDTELAAHEAALALKVTDLWIPFTFDGSLTQYAGLANSKFLPVFGNCTVVAVAAYLSTPATGQAVILDLNKNGTTICSTRPQIQAAGNTISTAAVFSAAASFTNLQRLSVDVDQAGSSVVGSNLVVNVGVRKA